MIVALVQGRWRVCGTRRRFVAAWWDSAPWQFRKLRAFSCCMGGPVDPTVTCRRYADLNSLWCKHHGRQIAKDEARP